MREAAKLTLFLFYLLTCTPLFSQDSTSIDYKSAYETAFKEYAEFEKNHGHYFQTRNVKMHYSTWGDPTDTPILWIHGTNSNTTEIVDFVDTLTSKDYFVIAIDYYGHGLTPIPDKEVSIYDVVDDINELMGYLEINQLIIGGWSRGGVIASAFYNTYPSKVSALILVDGGSTSFLKVRQTISRETLEVLYHEMYSSANDTSFASSFDAFSYYYNPKWNDSQYWWFAMLKQNDIGQWSLNPNLANWLGQRDENAGVRNIYQTTKAPLFESSTLLLSPEIVYRNLHVPLIIFNPQNDDENGLFAFTEENEKLKSQHPNLITLKHYPDSGHAVHFDQQERFTSDLLGFLAKIRASK